jgi:hypothetical protein
MNKYANIDFFIVYASSTLFMFNARYGKMDRLF